MLNPKSADARHQFCGRLHLLAVALVACSARGNAQNAAKPDFYARANTFGFFGAYSNDSSHILMGNAEQRKLLDFGAVYNRKLLLNHIVEWQYSGEILPVALESDPLSEIVDNQLTPTVSVTTFYQGSSPIICAPTTLAYSYTLQNGTVYSGTITTTCHGRRWTIGESFSPVGFQWNFLPSNKVQPFFVGHGGYIYSTQPIPNLEDGSFNFTFDLGAGIEFYRSKTRSVRAEYRYHHISNHNTAQQNPGIDNGLFQLTYTFGR